VLWNKVENSEKRVDSMLARHIDAALPVELPLDACKAMVKEFVKVNFTDKGMVADVAFHDMDSHNPHCHILLTTREIEGDGFADKKCAAWQASYNMGNGRVLIANGTIEVERESWANACNKALEKQGEEARIDHRSFKRQGIDKIPTFHIGKDAWHLEKRGIATTVMSRFKDIVFHNAAIEKLKAFQKAMQVKPFYKLSVLQKAREALHWFFDRSPQHDLAYPKPPPDMER
jgi:ATP-dependent exoDNAse (exonuclease V) alpha subunit